MGSLKIVGQYLLVSSELRSLLLHSLSLCKKRFHIIEAWGFPILQDELNFSSVSFVLWDGRARAVWAENQHRIFKKAVGL